ncbi:unnamed protein product [Thelazia callipaeda]|uniref:Neuroendocrine convertase 2 n=1 Tax=Thelazia callipaeda TaxID=103827 RepID=A0A0N5DBY4_THECL|nr:unnamed protein product [Thelazia callipaeda]
MKKWYQWQGCNIYGIILFAICSVSNAVEVYTNHFYVHTKQPGIEIAHSIAKRHGFINRGSVAHVEQLKGFKHLNLRSKLKYEIRVMHFDNAIKCYSFRMALEERLQDQLDFTAVQSPSDPFYPYQWYLKNIGQAGGKPKLDLNVEKAWALGITGKNITTAIMDDGVDYMHPDLAMNFNARASYDFSSNDPFPYPRYTDDWFNSHGTRCAGEIAAARDNGICGVGVAYDSKVAGIRMLDQPYMTDLIEVHDWGPTDDGKTVDGPRNATMRAIVKGVNEGRNGLGSIFVWASGDGGEEDDCNCDGYAASMWTISINSAINNGENAHYDESCSSTLASTFSNGGRNPETGVATTDLYGRCTRSHSGTSAAAPEAAGVFALALEANPFLTWRDLQHLTVLTSTRNSLFDGRCRDLPDLGIKGVNKNYKNAKNNCTHFEWKMNGVGLEFNHLFGFGVLDAAEMVMLAMVWKTSPPRFHCEAGTIAVPHEIPSIGNLVLELDTDACMGSRTEVNYLEHVQAVVTLNSTRRGDTTLYLISPSGTETMILSRRPKDNDNKDGFTNWPFMTTHTWGENPRGKWRLIARFQGGEGRNHGMVKKFTLMLHGTKDPPYTGIEPLQGHLNSKLKVVQKAHKRAVFSRRR